MAGKVHALVVTYRRPAELAFLLDALAAQSRPPDSVLVVDNDADDRIREMAAARGAAYLPMPENAGPAGGISAGLKEISSAAEQDDWVLLVDDDDPPQAADVVERLLRTATTLVGQGIPVGGVGLAGARFDRRTGRLQRVPDDLLSGYVRVDYIGGGMFPLCSAGALGAVGGPQADLFFGFEDLDLCLRLADAGYRLFVDGDQWRVRRRELGRLGKTARQARGGWVPPPWRRYYSTRNLIWITRRSSFLGALLATIRSGLLPAGADVWRQRRPGAATPALLGVVDAWRGRLGRTVEPGSTPAWR